MSRKKVVLDEGLDLGMKRSVLAVIVCTAISPAFAAGLDTSTSCTVAVQAFDSTKRAGEVLAGVPSSHEQEVGDYILSVMGQLDRKQTEAGKAGVWANFSEAGKRAIAASTVANCRQRPERTINQAAEAVYGSVRDIHIQLGIVK
jgi:hypothetical protein